MTANATDVLVIGAGPAGSAAATLLAEQGHGVTILEKDPFPRFQIGESLLPVCVPVLKRLGFEPREDVCLLKAGAEFLRESTGARRLFEFPMKNGSRDYAWQVDRGHFDARLLERARALGAQVQHGVKVQHAEMLDDQVQVQTSAGSYVARYLVDASGQGRVLARQMNSAKPYQRFGHAAAYTHFSGVSEEVFEQLAPGNHIRILLVDDGWGWIIPLPQRRLSVGLVTRRRGILEDLERFIQNSELIQAWTRGARRTPGRAVRGFSYRNEKPYGLRYVCVGDAACFLDPVFSSGVSLALAGAQRMAEVLSPALATGEERDQELMRPVGQTMDRGYSAFAAIIERFYHTHFVKHFIFGEVQDQEMKRGMLAVLAGYVWHDKNRFLQMLLNSRRRPYEDS